MGLKDHKAHMNIARKLITLLCRLALKESQCFNLHYSQQLSAESDKYTIVG